MTAIHERLRTYLLKQRIQLNVVASNPRQGGTMLLICLGCAKLSDGYVSIGQLNEPGNLGVLPGCRHDDDANPRSEADMDRLVLTAAKLAVLRHRLESDACDETLLARHRDLSERFRTPRTPGADGHYDPGYDEALLASVNKLEEAVERNFDSRAAEYLNHPRPRLILTIKEHNYNRNEAEFIRLVNLVKQSGGSLLFTTRHPADCFNSFFLRRTVHFLSAEGKVTNREIADFVTRMFIPSLPGTDEQLAMLDALTRYATEGFEESGDRIDLRRLLAFIGKAASDTPTVSDLCAVAKKIHKHCSSIMRFSYANTARYFHLARTLLPDATHRVEFDALLERPDDILASLAHDIPWISAFRTADWDAEHRAHLVNFPEAFVLPGSEIERNVWFKDTLAATGIRPRSAKTSRGSLVPAGYESCLPELENSYLSLFNDWSGMHETVK